jgi:cytochrome P450
MSLTRVFFAIVVGAVLYFLFFSSIAFSNLPPGPRPYPVIGNLLTLFKQGFGKTHTVFEDLHVEHGSIFTFWFAGARAPVISINDPKLAAAVLTDKKTYKSRPGVGWESFIPNSILILPSNDQWSFHRRMLTPAFSEKYLKKYFGSVALKTGSMLKMWDKALREDNGEVEAHGAFTALTLDVIGLAGFGQDFNCIENPDSYFVHAGNFLSHEAVTRFYQPRWMWWMDFKRMASFNKAMAYYTGKVYYAICHYG